MVSRSITRMPWVSILVQCWPLSWVAYSCGPNAQPSTPLRDRTPLTPRAPSGGPVTGAGMPCHVPPPLRVTAMDVQMSGLGPVHCPGVPAWPMTQPVPVETKVTEDGAKLTGTGGGPVVALALGDGEGLGVVGDGVGEWLC